MENPKSATHSNQTLKQCKPHLFSPTTTSLSLLSLLSVCFAAILLFPISALVVFVQQALGDSSLLSFSPPQLTQPPPSFLLLLPSGSPDLNGFVSSRNPRSTMTTITSHELNFLIFRYLHESGTSSSSSLACLGREEGEELVKSKGEYIVFRDAWCIACCFRHIWSGLMAGEGFLWWVCGFKKKRASISWFCEPDAITKGVGFLASVVTRTHELFF